MSNYSDFVGGSGGDQVGQLVDYPAVSSAPNGYVKADGAICPVACHTSLATCYANKLYTASASIPFAGTTYNFAPIQLYIEAFCTLGNDYCCQSSGTFLYCSQGNRQSLSGYISNRLTLCSYSLMSPYINQCYCCLASQLSCNRWTSYLCMHGGNNIENGINRLITPCGVMVTATNGYGCACMCCRGAGPYIAWQICPSWTNPVECMLKCGNNYIKHTCDKMFVCMGGGTCCSWMNNFGHDTTTICNTIVTTGWKQSEAVVITQNGTSISCATGAAGKQRMILQLPAGCSTDFVCGGEWCCGTQRQEDQLNTKVNYLDGVVGGVGDGCHPSCPFIGIVRRYLKYNCFSTCAACCDRTAGVFVFGGYLDNWYTNHGQCQCYCYCLTDRMFPISRHIMQEACSQNCLIGVQAGVSTWGSCAAAHTTYSNSSSKDCNNACRFLLGESNYMSFDIGYDRFISFGKACFGVGVVDGACSLTITCYPLTCIDSEVVDKVCYSNPLNKFIATTTSNRVYITDGNNGHSWTCVCNIEALHPILAIRNLDNKVAIVSTTGAVLLSCDGSSWNFIFNKDKMIVGDRSSKLIKWNNYYIGAGSVYSCDMCCSGYTVAPGKVMCSTTLGALVSSPTPAIYDDREKFNQLDHLGCCYLDGPTALEIGVYCSNFTDSLFWKFCSLVSHEYTCTDGQRINCWPIGGGVSELCDSAWGIYRVTCTGSCCARLYVKRIDLATCCVCSNSFFGINTCVISCNALQSTVYHQPLAPVEGFYYAWYDRGICWAYNYGIGAVTYRDSYSNCNVFSWCCGNSAQCWNNSAMQFMFAGNGVQWCSTNIECNSVSMLLCCCYGASTFLKYPTSSSCVLSTYKTNCNCFDTCRRLPRCQYSNCICWGCGHADENRRCLACVYYTEPSGLDVSIAGDGTDFNQLKTTSASQYYLANVLCPACGYCQSLVQGSGTIPINTLMLSGCYATTTGRLSDCSGILPTYRNAISSMGSPNHNDNYFSAIGGPAPCFDTSACFQVPNCPGKFIKT